MLAKMLGSVAFGAAVNDDRVHLSSVLIECTGEVARMVATDGRRLCLATAKHASAAFTLLIPPNATAELKRLGDAETIEIGLAGEGAHYRAHGVTYGFRVPNAAFPPYQQIMPEDVPAAKVGRIALLKALRAVGIAGAKNGKDGRYSGVDVTMSDGAIVIKAEGAETGSGQHEVECEYDGPKRRVGFDARYYTEWLQSSDADQVSLQIGGELDPMKLSDESSLTVVMPIRL
jgi:DNA polymerase-3 subunit beta